MRTALLLIIQVFVFSSCFKSEFEKYDVADDPFENRIPIEFDLLDYSDGPPKTLKIDWRMDSDYLNEFHPGHVVKVYSYSWCLAEISGSEGAVEVNVPQGMYYFSTVYVRIIVDGEVILESGQFETS